MGKEKVADLLEDVLQAGVQRVYGVSGDSLNGNTNSIRATKQIQAGEPCIPMATNFQRTNRTCRRDWKDRSDSTDRPFHGWRRFFGANCS
jgi:hypothetical protein